MNYIRKVAFSFRTPTRLGSPALNNRFAWLLVFSTLTAGCNSTSGGRVDDKAYARDVELQSVDAYQICTEQNPGNAQKCDALVKLVDADKKRLDKVSGGK